jgi:hypothetical protein
MMMETSTVITANTARFRDQVARPDTGSVWYGAENLRAMCLKNLPIRVLPATNHAGRASGPLRPRTCGKFKGIWLMF